MHLINEAQINMGLIRKNSDKLIRIRIQSSEDGGIEFNMTPQGARWLADMLNSTADFLDEGPLLKVGT